MTRSTRSLRPAVWLPVLGVFTLLGLLNAAQLWVGIRTEGPSGMGHGVSLPRLIGWQVGQWLGWGLLAPFVLALGTRFRLPSTRLTPWAVHGLASLLAALAHTALSTWLLRMAAPFGDLNPRSFADHYVGRLTSVLHVDLLIYAGILGVGYAFSYYQGLRAQELQAARLQTELARAQLEALSAQLRPHFLFNSLHGVAGLIRDGRPGAAIDMIEGLSDLLRYSLETRDTPKVPLRDEIAVAHRYLEIQRLRFGDRLSVETAVESDVETALVPPLLLQPLVENAIRHGVDATAGRCRIRVSAARAGERLRLEVLNDAPASGSRDGRNDNAGVGLSSTRARLDQLYRGRHSFVLEPVAGDGMVARVELPLESATGGAR